jgi:2-methylcitrate dehydratase PrpD
MPEVSNQEATVVSDQRESADRTVVTYDNVPSLEGALATHIARTGYEDLPSEALESAKRSLVWLVGTAIAGASAPGSEAILQFARNRSSEETCRATVLGTGQRAPSNMAGLANACYAKAHEYEDKFWIDETIGFAIGFAVVPTALAVAEERGGVDGKALLTSIAVATDVQARLLSAVQGGLGVNSTGWNSTYMFSNYGAAVAAGKVMNLSADLMLDTIGLVHAQASGNFQGNLEGVLGIRLQAGFAVRNGIAAADLASLGITGSRNFVSGRYGVYKLHFPTHTIDLDSLTTGLGEDYLGSRLGFKAYPCGLVVHPALDAIRVLREDLHAEDVRAIRVIGTSSLAIMTDPIEERRRPRNSIEAQFSLPWAVACVLLDGALQLRHFDMDVVSDDRYRSMAGRVDVHMDGDQNGTIVELELTDGSIRRSDPVKFAHGHPNNPMTTDEVIDVYGQCLEYAAQHSPDTVDRSAGEQVLHEILDIESCRDVADLLQPLNK